MLKLVERSGALFLGATLVLSTGVSALEQSAVEGRSGGSTRDHGLGPRAPETVAPGDRTTATRGVTECPTFSWSSRSEVHSFELRLLRAEDLTATSGASEADGLDEVWTPLANEGTSADFEDARDHRAENHTAEEDWATPVLLQRIDGAARSWTPAKEQCPGSGAFVWFIRSRLDGQVSDWSPGALFDTETLDEEHSREMSRSLLAQLQEKVRQENESALGGSKGTKPSKRSFGSNVAETNAVRSAVLDTGLNSPRRLETNGFVARKTDGIGGDISIDSDGPSRAEVALSASRLRLTSGNGSDFHTSDTSGNMILTGQGQDTFNRTLEVGKVYIDLFTSFLDATQANIYFSGTAWYGTGGVGYFDVPSAFNAKVDNNESVCGGRVVSGVKLEETDTGQIGVQVKCGN